MESGTGERNTPNVSGGTRAMGSVAGHDFGEATTVVQIVRELANYIDALGWDIAEVNSKRRDNGKLVMVSVSMVRKERAPELSRDAGAYGSRADKTNNAKEDGGSPPKSGLEQVCNTVCEVSQHCRTHGCYARTVLDTE